MFFSFVLGAPISLIKDNAEGEVWAFAKFWPDANLAIEAFDNVFWDDEAQANALRVHAFGVGDFAEESE